MEGAALERLYTKIKDDLVALPEKYSGDRRWQLHFPLTFIYLFIYFFIHGVKVIFWTSGRDNLLHWQMPNCVNCSQSTISLNVRHRCCLLLLNPFCISAFFSFSQQVQKKKKEGKKNFTAVQFSMSVYLHFHWVWLCTEKIPQVVTFFETLSWILHGFSSWFCFTLNWLDKWKDWAVIPLLTYPFLCDKKNVACRLSSHCCPHPLTHVLPLCSCSLRQIF